MDKCKNIKIASTFIGTTIGAGFASGREIALYFANTSPLSPLLAGIFCGIFCFVFLELGRRSKGDILTYTFKKYSKIISFFIKLSCIPVYCAMLAGCEHVIKNLFGINGGTVISAVLVLAVIYFGIDKLKLLNTVAVPFIMILIFAIFIKAKPQVQSFESFPLFSPILYACMNILSGGYLISLMAKDMTPSDCVKSSAICAAVLTLLLVLIYLLIQNYCDEAMPLLFAAGLVNMAKISSIVMYLAIFTTLAGSLYIVTGKNIRLAILITSFGLVISCFGFKTIVDKCYPVIGYFGAVLSAFAVFKLLFDKKDFSLEFSNS